MVTRLATACQLFLWLLPAPRVLADSAISTIPTGSVAQIVHFPGAESRDDSRADYPVAVLQMCHGYLNGQYHFAPAGFSTQQGRSLRLLQQDQGIDIVWTVSSHLRESQFLPVRIPLDRGLIGWRLMMVRQADVVDMDATGPPLDYAVLWAGQGHDWPDLEVLKSNGYRVTPSTTYPGLFAMLARGHIDYFPRSVSEIWSELQTHQHQNFAVAPGVALHYPELLYFFVRRDARPLAQALEGCLRRASDDGSLKSLFYRYYGDAIARANLPQRQLVELNLPATLPRPPNLPAHFWFTPGEAH